MKYIPYGRQMIDREDIEAVAEALESDWITQGPKIKEFEDSLCKYTGAKYAVCVSSGTAALHIACLAAEIKHGDEVITSPITFVASANCVLYCGGRPVFADIQEDTVNIDPKEIKKKIAKKTKAIIPVHFAGHPCDLEEINNIARRYRLVVIEDAAHALGAEYKGTKIGSCRYSDMTTLSFHPVKSITTGEGGAVLTNNKKLYQRLQVFRNHGIVKQKSKLLNKKMFNCGWYYEMQELGFNYRLTDIQTALGISQLKKLGKFIKRRREIASIYNEELSYLNGIILPKERDYVHSSWHIYCIRLKEAEKRKVVFNKLRNAGIGTQVHYIPIYSHPYYKKILARSKDKYLAAENYYASALTLPIYPQLKNIQIKYIVNSLKKLLR